VTLLESLLDAIVRLEGDALVMHVGEKPYVVTTSSTMNAYRGPLAWGQVELSSRVLTPDAVMSMVAQILPADQRVSLEEVGAVEHEIASPAGNADRFTVVAARGGDDIWLELRRHPLHVAEPVATPEQAVQIAGAGPYESVAIAVGVEELPVFSETPPAVGGEPPAPDDIPPIEIVTEVRIEERVPVIDEVGQHVPEHVEHVVIPVEPAESPAAPAPQQTSATEDAGVELVEAEPQHSPTDADVDAMLAATAAALMSEGPGETLDRSLPPKAAPAFEIVDHTAEQPHNAGEIEIEEEEGEASHETVDLTVELNELPPGQDAVSRESVSAPELAPAEASNVAADRHEVWEVLVETQPEPVVAPVDEPHVEVLASDAEVSGIHPMPTPEPPIEQITGVAAAVSAAAGAPEGEITVEMQPTHAEAESRRAAAAAMPRATTKFETPPNGMAVTDAGLLEVLKAASERGASIMYVVAQSKPMIRVDGAISALDHGQVWSAPDVERLVAALAPAQLAESAKTGPVEWISDVADVGRVRCVTFRDHRGPGLIFRMVSSRSISADHLALPPELRELCAQTEGLVLITGPRGSGRSTLLAAFVDLINRTRSDHIISLESQIGFTHESRRSFISQREVRDDQSAAAAVAGAMKEDPDVLVVEDVSSAAVASAVLDAAESGRLVFASVTSSSTAGAIKTLLELFPETQRLQARAALAASLRAVVSQMLLRKLAGGRTAARELLVNTPAVATLILEGKNVEIPSALDSGRRQGMMPLTDSLATLVREGTVHAAEAYRRAPDRAALIAALSREGVDTSFAERLA
jgi:twitching motility protein PilT